MKGRSVIQQPFGKLQASKHLTIQINQPQSPIILATYTQNKNLPNIIKEQIDELKARIESSQKILQDSRRQDGKSSKMVASDYIPLHFNYESANNYKPNILLGRLEERQSEYQIENEESEGAIQLPIHLQPSIDKRNYLSERNAEQISYFKSKHIKLVDSDHTEQSLKTERVLGLNTLTNSLERQYPNKIGREIQTPKSNQHIGFYRDQFLKERLIPTSKERIQKENDQKSKQKNTIKSVSKEKSIVQQKSIQKIKIKLNCPSQGNTDRKDRYFTRPRYQIKMPPKGYNEDSSRLTQNSSSAKLPIKNEWEQLKQKIKKYQFVRKYLNQTDLHGIYEHLKKNRINQEKWPLFVVDQAYKRMNKASH